MFAFLLLILSFHVYAQPADSLEDKNFDDLLKWGNVPIGGNFGNEKSKQKLYSLFMHRGKLLHVKYFLCERIRIAFFWLSGMRSKIVLLHG
jgi:hypothetical protein